MNTRAEMKIVNEEQAKRIENIRNTFSDIYDYIGETCKNSRETALGLTKLEEAQFWLIKGISREE